MSFLDRHLCILPIDVHIDPTGARERAIITHGHGDHARRGHGHVLATADTIAIMKARYGEDCAGSFQVAEFGAPLMIEEVEVTLFPAGHILGSAQVRLRYRGQTIVVTGDYKRLADPTAPAFELVPCDILVTEATFGLPVFQHPQPADETARLLKSVADNPERSHLVGAYALGKAQRVMSLLRRAGYDRPIYLHGAMVDLTRLYEARGIALGPLRLALDAGKDELANAIVIAPPGALKDRWSRRLPDPVLAMASGWMSVKQRARQSGVELPLVISDHADWNELRQTIAETGASEVWVTHGREDALVYWCRQQGLMATPLNIVGYDEAGEDAA
ncbi:MAG: ligase-associated DNA damage response exonuclease [Devosia sp.]|nr:ligase-associated DNA damage response exonuclease [Devosia sp.]